MFSQEANVVNCLKKTRFTHINPEDILIKASNLDEWNSLRNSWDYLSKDKYMKENDSYRKRAIGKFTYDLETRNITAIDDTKFFQKTETNKYAGGIERVFLPMSDKTKSNKILHEIIRSCLNAFLEYKPIKSRYWNIYVHQFRIEAIHELSGYPTPEGIHQDGHSFISMHMISKIDVSGGISKIYDRNRVEIKEITLSKPLESILLDDKEMFHFVSPIKANENYGYRDIMIIDYNEVESV